MDANTEQLESHRVGLVNSPPAPVGYLGCTVLPRTFTKRPRCSYRAAEQHDGAQKAGGATLVLQEHRWRGKVPGLTTLKE